MPSRNRFEYGFTAASATTVPSGDHVGRPGWNSGGVICWTAPPATSRIHTAPSWSV